MGREIREVTKFACQQISSTVQTTFKSDGKAPIPVQMLVTVHQNGGHSRSHIRDGREIHEVTKFACQQISSTVQTTSDLRLTAPIPVQMPVTLRQN